MSTVIRFEAGRALSPWPRIPDGALATGHPRQSGHLYFQDDAFGLKVGLWHSTAFASKRAPHASSEYCLILEGAVCLHDDDGHRHLFGPGEALLLPKGCRRVWEQQGECRKVFFIFEDPAGIAPGNPAALRPIRLEGRGPGGAMAPLAIDDPARYAGAVPTQHLHLYYSDASGRYSAGVWDSTAMTTVAAPFPRHELMCLLEGEATIREQGVGDHRFAAGDSFLVQKGAPISWVSEGYVRKYFVMFHPDRSQELLAAAAQ